VWSVKEVPYVQALFVSIAIGDFPEKLIAMVPSYALSFFVIYTLSEIAVYYEETVHQCSG
jgi:hypothetical protein